MLIVPLPQTSSSATLTSSEFFSASDTGGSTLLTSDTQPMLLDLLVDAEGCDFGPAEVAAGGKQQKAEKDP